MKLYQIVIIITVLFLGTSFVVAEDKSKGGPFQAIWEVIADLQEQVNNNAIQGAGNIAFIFTDGSGIHALTNDGRIWIWTSSAWLYSGPNIDVPIPVSDITQWELTALLDTNGDIWKWDGPNWTNYGTPI